MSYSFSVRATDQQDAKEKIGAELAKVVEAQPIHQADRRAAQSAAESFVNLLRVDDEREIVVSVTGSCWGEAAGLNGCSVSVSASLTLPDTQQESATKE